MVVFFQYFGTPLICFEIKNVPVVSVNYVRRWFITFCGGFLVFLCVYSTMTKV